MSTKPLVKPSIPLPSGAAGSLADIRQLVAGEFIARPGIHPSSSNLGGFEPLWRWLAESQQKTAPKISHPRIALFMAAHGAFPEQQTGLAGILAALKNSTHAASRLVAEANADLQVYELDLQAPCGDFRAGPALNEAEAAQALAYGMMAVQPGVDLLLLAALNPAAAEAGAAMTAALKENMDPLDALLRFGGFDIAAITGALLAAWLARVPVILEGDAAVSAGALLERLKPGAAAHAKNTDTLLSEKSALPLPCGGALLIPLLKALVCLN